MLACVPINDRLNKGMIGEYLGDGDKHVIEIMYDYVESLDFKKMDFVDALRYGQKLFVNISIY
jgi:Sec7-like guanine-nucleotide exchange factor